MIIPTHKIIGTYIHDAVLENINMKLDKRNLVIGSVLPDIMPKYIKQKHFFEVSYDYILKMIEQLYNDSYNMSMKEFSLRLGIITHYLSDFFCTPHNDRDYYHNHIKEHMQFETKLHFLFSKNKKIETVEIPNIKTIDYHNIKAIIDKLHNEYNQRGTSYENDFYSTLNAVNIISSLLVSHCFESYGLPAMAS